MFSRSPLSVNFKHSPSLLLNNLSVSRLGSGMGYRTCHVHKDDLIVSESRSAADFEKTTKVQVKPALVYSAAIINFSGSSSSGSSSSGSSSGGVGGDISGVGGGGASSSGSSSASSQSDYLIVASNLGAQLWSADGERMLWFHKLQDIFEEVAVSMEAPAHYMRGAASLVSSSGMQCVAIGSSLGILVVAAIGGSVLTRLPTLSCSPITAVVSSSKFLFCGNDEGGIIAFRINSAFDNFLRIPGKGDACTAICCNDSVVVAAFATGHLRVYRSDIGELSIEIAAHARGITGISVHQSQGYLATCGEDCIVNVWTFPDFLSPSGSDMDLAYSCRIDNSMCTGVAWTGDGRLLVASYDTNELAVFYPK